MIYVLLLVAGLFGSAVVYDALVHFVPGMKANRADTVKTALLVVGGSGALAGLYVSYRKQRTDELNHVRDRDKLFTDRYTAAVAQLGNPAAAVRLGGVYALARIADGSQPDRPTCLNVLCAYLRMPYEPDDPATEKAERQVRTAAQIAISERLRPDHPGFWTDARIDLTDAYLIDLDFRGITVGEFKADRATFSERYAWFDKATFNGHAGFREATFNGYAWFENATFNEDAGFDKATFGGSAAFRDATFSKGAGFDKATFSKDAWFDKATFEEYAGFGEATFSGDTGFPEVTFLGDAGFREATFSGRATFRRATFSKGTRFDGARFRQDHPPVWPEGFAEPTGIVWNSADPPAPGTPPADPEDPPKAP